MKPKVATELPADDAQRRRGGHRPGGEPRWAQTIAGKTGTASTGGTSGGQPLDDAWFVGFAPVNDPKIAVAVELTSFPTAMAAPYAAPIAAQVIKTLLAERSMSEFEAGTIIDGRYRVLSRLGAGGMADVYLAQDEQLDREIALKLLHRRFAEDAAFVERFRREAQAAASLQHPNVVSVFDRGAFDGTYYIAMEYLQGRTLKRLIREEAPLEVNRAIDLTIQILKAARFAHRRGVIHRDLKPHNVIVDDNDHVKVTDFGIARAGASDMTETGSIMGTAQYLSPEQAQGHAVSAPSDLYSVGIVLYEMLTGRVPFDGESPVSIALKHVSEAPIPPSQLNTGDPIGARAGRALVAQQGSRPTDRPTRTSSSWRSSRCASRWRRPPARSPPACARSSGGAAGAGRAVTRRQACCPLRKRSAPTARASHLAFDGDRLDNYDDDDHRTTVAGPRIWPWIVGLLVRAADRRRCRRLSADAPEEGDDADRRRPDAADRPEACRERRLHAQRDL